MAVVETPLLSLRARGGFASTYVFAEANRQATARKLTRAANPRTTLQTAARQDVANAVQAWHEFMLQATRADLQAWRQLVQGYKGQSGYNGFTARQLRAMKLGHAPVGHLTRFVVTNAHAEQVGFNIKCSEGAGVGVDAYIGQRPGWQAYHAGVVTDVDGYAVFTNIAVLGEPGQTVFVYAQAPALFIRSGLYRLKLSF